MPASLLTDNGVRTLRVDPDCPPMVKSFIEDPTFVTGFFGPLGCGKTTAGALKAWLYGQAWPGAKVAIIRDTWPNLRDTTQSTFFDWFPDGIAGRYLRTERKFLLWTEDKDRPAEMLFRAMDQKEDMANVLSLDLAAAWVDEPQGGLAARSLNQALVHEPGIDADLFKAIQGRLGRQHGYPGMCWLTGNPPEPTHWIAREFRYTGKGEPKNERPEYQLYNGTRDTNRRNLQHHFDGEGEACSICGRAREEVIHQADYYERLEGIYGSGTPLAMRFLDGLWVPFALLSPFQIDWIQYFEERPKLQDCYVCIGVDPAISKKDEANRSAIVVSAQPLRGIFKTYAYVVDYLAGHWSAYEIASRILRFVEKYPMVRRLRMESNAWQIALKEIVEDQARVKGISLPFVDCPVAKEDKLMRASGISGPVQVGCVQFGPGQQDLIDCMISVPRDPMKWDPVDALYWSLTGLPQLKAEQSPADPEKMAEARKLARSYVPQTSKGLALAAPGGRKFWSYNPQERRPAGRRVARSYAMRLV